MDERTCTDQRRLRWFRGDENVLIIAPAELKRAVIHLDGKAVAYLWLASHVRSSGVDQHYMPPFPASTEKNASTTRIHARVGRHIVEIESTVCAPITKEFDISPKGSLLITITRNEIEPLQP
jgi:hypothetical protein